MKFLFDLFPVIVFFLAYKFWGIFIATAGSILATVAQIIWVAVRHRRVEPSLWMNLAVIVVLGGATLAFHNEAFIKWKPTALYWLFSAMLTAAQFGFKKNPIKAMLGAKVSLPEHTWRQLNLAWAIFFAVLGALNLIIAYLFSTNTWVTFKLFGGGLCLLAFVIAQGVWVAKHLRAR